MEKPTSTSTPLKNVRQEQFRMATLVKAENENFLLSKNINVGSTIMAQKKPPGLAGHSSGDIRTNVHEIGIAGKMPLYLYDIDITGVRRTNSPLAIEHNLSMGRATDHEIIFRRFFSFAVFQAFVAANPGIFEENALYFDCAKILYALHPLPIESGKYYDVTLPQVMQFVTSSEVQCPYTTFKIKFLIADKAESRITLGDMSYIAQAEDASKIDTRMNQFLDIATSQNIFIEIQKFVHYSASSYYLLNPSLFGFTEDDCPNFKSNHSFLGIGARKAIRAIEPELNEPNKSFYGMVFELKKSAFHINMGDTIATKYAELMASQHDQAHKIEEQLRAVYVETTYDPKRIFSIDGIYFEGNAATTTFLKDGATITIGEYYMQKYKIALQFPNYPLVIRKRAKEYTEFYPMEVLAILDNQRVKNQHQTSQQIKDMIKKTAVPPAVLVEESERVRGALALQDSPYLQKLSVRVEERPIHVQARVIPAPDLVFSHNFTEKPKLPQCTWSGRNYLVPASLNKWSAVAFSGTGRDSFHSNDWTRFVSQFRTALIQRGNQCPEPTEIRVVSLVHDSVNAILQNHLALGTEYILIGHPDGSDKTHAAMKFFEQKTEIVTQGVKLSTVRSMLSRERNDPRPQKPLTLANILHKYNMKMGGLNYIITGDPDVRNLLNENTLVIGFSMNHPSGGFRFDNTAGDKGEANGKNGAGNGANGNGNGANGGTSGSHQKQTPINGRQRINLQPPSVIGFAANTGNDYSNAFIGDFIYQQPRRDEKIELVAEAITRSAKQKFIEDPTKMQRLIIFRNACGEGSFESILKYEVPLVRYELAQVGFIGVKITLMVVNKLQGVRLVPKQIDPRARSSDQNIKPGTVVDTKIVHPKWTEFYLNSHRALQGTAKTPRYTVLLDDSNFSIDSLQKMAHHLCFCHQIVYSPTSLPTPVFVAEEYAKRGRNIYNYWFVHVTSNGQQKDMLSDYPDLTQQLSYQNTQYLRNLRLNA